MKKTLRKSIPLFAVISLLFHSGISYVQASDEELHQASMQMCEKMKSCALAQMQGQNIPAEMREMATQMIEGMCAQIRQQYRIDLNQQKYYKPAAACLNSISRLSCKHIQESGDTITPECLALQEMTAEK